MSLKISFPRQQDLQPSTSELCLNKFFDKLQFFHRIRSLCKRQFGMPDLFQFSVEAKNKNQWIFKCPKKCSAYLLYECEQEQNQDNPFKYYSYKFSQTEHLHPVGQLRAVDISKLRPYLPKPIIIDYPCVDSSKNTELFPQKYKKVVLNDDFIQNLLQQMHEQLGMGLVLQRQQRKGFNNFVIRCKLSKTIHKELRCRWKMTWHPKSENMLIDQYSQMLNSDNQKLLQGSQDRVMIFSPQNSYLQHKHYATSTFMKKQVIQAKIEASPFKKQYNKYYLSRKQKLAASKTQKQKQIQQQKKPHHNFQQQDLNTQQIVTTNLPVCFDENLINAYERYQKTTVPNKLSNLPFHLVLYPLLKKLTQREMDYKCLQDKDCADGMNKLMKRINNKELGCSIVFDRDDQCNQNQKKFKIKVIDQFHGIQKTQDASDFQDIVLISSKNMRYLSRCYGEVVYITEHKFQPTCKNNNKREQSIQFSVLYVCAKTFNQNIIILAVALCRNITPEKRMKILYLLFKYHLKETETIFFNRKNKQIQKALLIVKQQINLKSALISINQKTSSCHRSENGFSYTSEYSKYKQIAKKQTYLQRQKIIISPTSQQQTMLNSVPYISHIFMGVTDSIQTQAQQIYKECINMTATKIQALHLDYQQNYNAAKVIQFHEHMLNLFQIIYYQNKKWCHRYKYKYQVQHYFKFPELISCRRLMSQRIFEQFLYQLQKAQRSSIIVSTNQFFLVDDGICVFIVEIKKVRNMIQNGVLKIQQMKTQFNYESERVNAECVCQCGFKYRAGIPCSHMLKVMLHKKISLLESVKLSKIVNLGIIKPRFRGYFRCKRKKKQKN